ncbi:hypothetical protein K9B33_16405 [Sphingobium sp. 3R8]|uniref:hypothetical protein n=1 Tax=Sphingobium sp. 3R8 TaxID=2874921 RepID=UPI001CCF09EE|nr:hypothetical protein [Sphingobium sp. 3R8]MBZ9649122.1 hypothetical protein [Sphingobium sp. 3R8]
MTLALPQAVMTIAIASLGDRRREWALAMQAEFEIAVEDERQMAFAAGCLVTAWRDMHRHGDGRLTLASYALGLGLFVPMAAVHLACVIDFLFVGTGVPGGALLAGASANPVLGWTQARSIPALILLWSSLGVGHLCLAWLLLNRDWLRIFKVGAAVGAATVTLLLLMAVLLLDTTVLISHVVMLAIEFIALAAAARWHARLISNALPGTA